MHVRVTPTSRTVEPLKGATLMPSVYRILIADPIHEQARNLLTSRPGFEVAIATGLDEAELAERIGGYDGIIVRSKTA